MNALRWTGPVVVALAAVVSAQVPLSQEPRHHIVFENAQFRILNVDVPAGDTTLMHLHDHDLVTVSMTSGTDTRVQGPGEAWANRAPRPLGDVAVTDYTGKPQSHRLEVLGKTPYQLFAVEQLRASGSTAAAPLAAGGTTVAKESRSFRVYDVRLVRDRSQTSHTHAVPTIAVLLSGKVMSEGPDEKAKANAPAAVGLKQLDRPGQWVLIPAGDTHHLVRLASGDAQVVEIEVR